jgi:hypothetical protein
MPKRILVVGAMRSGKSTIAGALGRLDGVEVVEEPDNPLSRPFAFRVKRGLGQRYFPMLSPADRSPEYELLWQHAFGAASGGARAFSNRERAQRRLAWKLLIDAEGKAVLPALSDAGRTPVEWRLRVAGALAVPERPQRTTPNVLVTANEPLAAEWIAERLAAAVVVVLRDPLELVSSWAQLDWLGGARHDMLDELDPRAAAEGADAVGVPVPAPGAPPLLRAAWLAGLFAWHLQAAARRNPSWTLVLFEEVATEPVERLQGLAETLGLTWRDGAADGVLAGAPGSSRAEPQAVLPRPAEDALAEAHALLTRFPTA